VIHDQWIDGCISVRASNVTIYNVLVRSTRLCIGGKTMSILALISTGDNGGGGISGLNVHDVELDGQGAAGDTMGIGQTEFTCTRCNIHGTAKGAKGDQNVTVRDSYVHDLAYDRVTHTEGFFFDGGAGNIVVAHNWIKANEDLSTAAVSFNNDFAGHHATVDSNYLEGSGGADFTGGSFSNKPAPSMDHITVTNNALSPNNGWGGKQFAYGFDAHVDGNSWTGNVNAVSSVPIDAPGPS